MRCRVSHRFAIGTQMALLALLAGCAPTPVPTTWWITTQPKLQAAQHWDLLAGQVVAELAAAMPPESTAAVELAQPPIETDFSQAFRGFLTTRLMDRGYRVWTHGAPVSIEYRSQVVQHAGRDRDHRPPPGTFTALGALVGIGDVLASHWNDPVLAGAGFGVGLALDAAAGAYTSNSDTELVESVLVVDRGVVNFERNYIFYINTDERGEYEYVATPPMPPPPAVATLDLGASQQLAKSWNDADRLCQGANAVAVPRRVDETQTWQVGCWGRY
jgi:hypothetical protein